MICDDVKLLLADNEASDQNARIPEGTFSHAVVHIWIETMTDGFWAMQNLTCEIKYQIFPNSCLLPESCQVSIIPNWLNHSRPSR